MPGNAVSVENGFLLILKDLGLEPANVLRRAHLPADLLTREGVRIAVEEYFDLWNAMEAEAGDPTLPIRIAECLSPEMFHPPLFAALCSPDMTVATRRIAEYKRLVAPVTVLVDERPDGLYIGMRWDAPGLTLPPTLAAVELTWMTQLARIATRERVVPARVECPYPLEPVDAYEAFFGVRPVQDGDRHGALYRPEDARRPFLTANEAMWDAFEPELRRRLTRLDASAPLTERVQSILLEGLPSGETSIDITARRLGMSPRTLQRRLREDGTSFKTVVRDTRERLARHYVTNTSLAYAEISFLIGFEEPGSFFRAFREWTGETPEAARQAAG